ncbi:MAG TPA: DMT family transporter [Acidimicrobiia bacterium]
MTRDLSTRRKGILLAAGTAVISGFAVFLNGYAVRAWAEVSDATTYTTAKNLLAGLAIGLFGLGMSKAASPRRPSIPAGTKSRVMLVAIAVIGGSVPFALFFEGLARASSAQAAIIHKTLVVWVTLLALVFLRERIGWPHVGAIGLLVWGQTVLAGGLGALSWGSGETLILVATLLWSVEVVVAKRLLPEVSYATVAKARMIGGAAVLVAWTLVRGADVEWAALTSSRMIWVVVAAVFLSGYVLTWFAALSMAPAVDVTAVLVGGALITAFLQSTLEGDPLPDPTGALLVLAGMALAAAASWRRPGASRL